jgi:alkylation response protein AidB-like acyl-CoA dehydrogenase
MEFRWTEEQLSLRDTIRRMLEAKAPLSRSRALGEAGERHDPALWAELSAAGIPALAVPEAQGGLGGSMVELALVAEQMGRVLLGGPFLSSGVLAAQALTHFVETGDDTGPASAYLTRLAEGTITATLAVTEFDGRWTEDSVQLRAVAAGQDHLLSGSKPRVLDGLDADVVLVAARDDTGVSLYAVDADASGMTKTSLAVLDFTRPMAALDFDRVQARRVGTPGNAWPAIERALWYGTVYLAAESCGSCAAVVETTAEYARTRRQFGRPIGAFQGVKHRLADMAVRLELSRSVAFGAGWRASDPDSAMSVAIAGSYVAESFLQTAKDMIQLHGGIGFTWEHDAHLFLRRARASASLLRTPGEHRAALEPFLMAEETA